MTPLLTPLFDSAMSPSGVTSNCVADALSMARIWRSRGRRSTRRAKSSADSRTRWRSIRTSARRDRLPSDGSLAFGLLLHVSDDALAHSALRQRDESLGRDVELRR